MDILKLELKSILFADVRLLLVLTTAMTISKTIANIYLMFIILLFFQLVFTINITLVFAIFN